MSIVVLSGSRDLSTSDETAIEARVVDLLYELSVGSELRFGGARGTDTVALEAACVYRDEGDPSLVVHVPGKLENQPQDAREVIRECADYVVELGYAPGASWAYLKRNERMLEGADRLIAFWDGASPGTRHIIEKAEARGIDVEIVRIGLESVGSAAALDGWAKRPEVGMDVYVLSPYISARHGRRDRMSMYVRALKKGVATASQVNYVARAIANAIRGDESFDQADALIPIPRRVPGHPPSLLPVLDAVAATLDIPADPDWLVRVREPKGGTIRAFRKRHEAEEHADSLRVREPGLYKSVVLMDDVVTFGGTMEGARLAIKRDSPRTKVAGFAVLGSLKWREYSERKDQA